MAENFDLIFGQNASQQYAWSDSDYQDGWETIGNIPPTAAQFDALQRRNDMKTKELNDNLTPLVNANTADTRQPATAYNEGDMKYSPLLPTGWFLSCVVAGTTSAGEIVLPSPVVENASVADGSVTWTIRKIGSGGGEAVGVIKAFAGNGDIPSGYLLCDGSAVSRTMFPDLFAAIGTTYGSGDGSTTFNVPDYNSAARFAQGGTVAGVEKEAGLPNIEGTFGRSQSGASTISPLHGGNTATGAFSLDYNTYSVLDTPSGSMSNPQFLNLDASQSNPIYGASDTVQPESLTTRYIIKAFDGQTSDSALVDITQYAQELATKANRQLSNLDTANLACHVVVDSYYDSTTGDWWREYDDGWIEQGGIAASGSTTVTVTFLKPMRDTLFNVTLTNINSNQATYSGYCPCLYTPNTTTTTMRICQNSDSRYKTVWSVCGMGASV